MGKQKCQAFMTRANNKQTTNKKSWQWKMENVMEDGAC